MPRDVRSNGKGPHAGGDLHDRDKAHDRENAKEGLKLLPAKSQKRPNDYSETDAKVLVSHFVWASRELYRMVEEARVVGAMMKNPATRADDKFQGSCVRFFVIFRDLSTYLLGIISATTPEIFKRGMQNRSSWDFGVLKMAADAHDNKTARNAFGRLCGVAINVARRHGWQHPEGRDGWVDLAHKTLAKELHRHEKMGISSLLEKMVDRRFGYLWKAFENDFIDELRSLKRRPEEAALSGEVREHLVDNFPSATRNPEEEYLFRAALGALRKPAKACDPLDALVAEVLADMLPQTAGKTEAEIEAEFVKEIAKRRRVSPQQARRDFQRIKRRKTATLQELKGQLRFRAQVGAVERVAKPMQLVEREED